MPYFDRLDYVSVISNELAFCILLEKILLVKVPLRAKVIRVIFMEITRILNHLIAVTTHALDVGAVTPFLWAFEEREKLLEFYERVSGARIHANYIRPGGVAQDISNHLLNDIYTFCLQFLDRLNEIEELLTNNRIWKQRLINVGLVTFQQACIFGFTGVLLRGTGIPWDLRKSQPYDGYNTFNFIIPIGKNSDCFDRYILRIEEIRQSHHLIKQCLKNMPDGLIKTSEIRFITPDRNSIKTSIESLIIHFKLFTEGFNINAQTTYAGIEAPKGEFGVYIIANDSNIPYRCKIRAPGYFHLQAIDYIARDHLLADLVTIIGTQDIVFGEIDR